MIRTITREALLAILDRVQLAEALPEPYYRKGHLPGATLLPHTEVASRAHLAVPDRGATTVLYCWDLACGNAELAAEQLLAMGYTDVRVYPGGKVDWMAAGLTLERGGPPVMPGEELRRQG